MAKTLSEIAERCGAVLQGDGSRLVVGPADLEGAGPEEVSFLANPRYAPLLETTRAAAVLVQEDLPCRREDLALLRVRDPNRAFSAVVELFAPAWASQPAGVHPTAVVAGDAVLGEGVSVGPHCFVDRGVVLGDGVELRAGVVLGEGVRVGAGTTLHPRVVVYAGCSLGERCVVHAGAVLGADGFGFDPTPEGWEKVPQCGTVVVGDDVEIGANACIDRARFGATRIGDMVKIDNLVQVGHNCVVEPAALLCAQVGMAGSATVRGRAILAGQVGVNGHIEIGAGARVGGQAGVVGDLPPGGEYTGWPARPARRALREAAELGRLPELAREVRALRARLEALEGGEG